MKAKTLIVDDHAMLRSGLRQTLAQFPNLEIVGEASNGTDAFKLVNELKPDLVFMDVHLPDLNGIELSRRILSNHHQIKIIIFSSDDSRQLVDEALHAGACGYLSKSCLVDELGLAVESVLAGKLYLSPAVSSEILNDYRKNLAREAAGSSSPLSELDRQIMRFIAEGLRNKEIGANLNMTTKAVEAYRSRLMKKLGCSSSAELIRYAVREGIAKP